MQRKAFLKTYVELDELDLDKLSKILPVPLDIVIDLVDESVNPPYSDAFDEIKVYAELQWDEGSTYDPENSWEGYAYVEDLEVILTIDKTMVDITDCLSYKKRTRIEERLWETLDDEE